jgi:hypothetical protein
MVTADRLLLSSRELKKPERRYKIDIELKW